VRSLKLLLDSMNLVLPGHLPLVDDVLDFDDLFVLMDHVSHLMKGFLHVGR
jgi:hypothetical protein